MYVPLRSVSTEAAVDDDASRFLSSWYNLAIQKVRDSRSWANSEKQDVFPRLQPP